MQLSSSRGNNGFGPNPLDNTEIKSFFELEGIQPEYWEIDLLRKLERTYMQNYAKQSAKDRKAQESKTKSKGAKRK